MRRLPLWLLPLTGCLASLPNTTVTSIDGSSVELAKVDVPLPAVLFESGLGGQLEW